MPISQVGAHQILDSRGYPTVEVHLALDSGAVVTAAAPAGASVGRHEAIEIRDREVQSFLGLSVSKAINSINQVLGPALIGKDPAKQGELDKIMVGLDGTPDKSKLGGNAIIATSEAVTKAGAVQSNKQLYTYISELSGFKPALPTPMFNLINGGLHGSGNLEFQEFMVVPAKRVSYSKALEMGDEAYLNLKEILNKKGLLTAVGDEGGFAPNLFTNAAALDLLVEAIRLSGFKLGEDVFLALDVAATQLKHGDRYFIRDSSEPMSVDGLIGFYRSLISKYNILSLEDPLAEDDFKDWRKLKTELGGSVIIIGDDLTVTNPSRVQEAVADESISGVIIKPNQIGTISEALDVVKISREHNLTVVASHRSGETDDSFIADFAVGVGADYFKGGAPARGERIAKYNRLLEIEVQLAAQTS